MLRALLLLILCFAGVGNAQDRAILVQSTTSTQNSGFYDYILPIFTAETGIKVNVVAVGTGQALRNAMNGDADVLLVHSTADEIAFVESGNGVERFDLMYNDFVVVGPAADPLDIASQTSITGVLSIIAQGSAKFISRGDDSGTHKKEHQLWQAIDFAPDPQSGWYLESGSGMGATLRLAIELQAYTLSDRATWIAYENKLNSQILFAGDPPMHNQYGIIALNPDRHPHVNAEDADIFIDWMLSPHGQSLIAAYRVQDMQLFFPNATVEN